MKIYIVDNYDSFVYNLVHLLKELQVHTIRIEKNDKVDLEEIKEYDKILLSPGPGIPKDAGRMPEVIRQYHATHSMLGVCLGHQAIGEYFGCALKRLQEPLHGIASQMVILDHQDLFLGMPDHNTIGHYHSWTIDVDPSSELKIIGLDKDNNVMAIRHRIYKTFGVQFHPESVLTENGKRIIQNWLNQ